MFVSMKKLAEVDPIEFRMRSSIRTLEKGLEAAIRHRPGTQLVEDYRAALNDRQRELSAYLDGR